MMKLTVLFTILSFNGCAEGKGLLGATFGGMFGGPHEGKPPGIPGGMHGRESNETELVVHGGQARHFVPGIKFFNDTCTPDSSTSSTCEVGSPMNESNGAWVCRTLFDIVSGESETFSACVDTQEFIETDTCGCCDDECPSMDPCPCTCDLMSSGDIVSVQSENMDLDLKNISGVLVKEKDSTEMRCVPTEVATQMINGPGFFGRAVCVEECPDV